MLGKFTDIEQDSKDPDTHTKYIVIAYWIYIEEQNH